jgi:hypothetical protein
MVTAFRSWNSYWAFARAIRSRARFIHDRRVRSFLSTVAKTIDSRTITFPVNKVAWRAQLGHDWQEQVQDGHTFDEPVPFSQERMKPMPSSAHEGRVNPRGIPCLYAANNKETAVAEVRPWLGALVSVARLKVKRELKLVDCVRDDGIENEIWFEEPPPEERNEIVWRAIGRAFSDPVSPDPGIAEYAPTQVLAEQFKSLGFDGLVYRSRLSKGTNLAVFDLNALEILDVHLVPVKAVRYEIGETQKSYTVRHV